MPPTPSETESQINAVRQWVESFVVGLNLCPFARREMGKGSVRFVTTGAITGTELLVALKAEFELLDENPAIETTLLIHPAVLTDFYNYNGFLGAADSLLVDMGLEGIYQIASFHPDYQFDGTQPDDAENYTNRAPYPMLHIIREESLERAIAEYPDVEQIPPRNIALMNQLGKDKLEGMLSACFKAANTTP